MDFRPTEEQLLLQRTVKEFTQSEIEPKAQQVDREGRLPDDLIGKMAHLKLLGMTLPAEYGGAGASTVDCVLAIEQVSYSGCGAWWLLAFSNSIPASILTFGTEEQKGKYLRPVCEGKVYPSIQFTEADTGSDPEALVTVARAEKNHFVINGAKRFSTFGARDGYAVLYAKDDVSTCTAIIVDKGAEGYTVSKPYELMGGGGIEAVDVYFSDVRVPRENILGTRGKGLHVLLSWIADEKIQQCAACIGIAQAALDEAVRYVKIRRVKGKVQADFQGIRWMLAELHPRLQAARWLTYRCAFLKDQGSPDWMTEAAAAKLFVVPATSEVVEMSRRIHGAYGYTKEFKIERLYRAIAGASAIAVSLEINRSMVAAACLS